MLKLPKKNNYHSKRYQNDPAFRERIKLANRLNELRKFNDLIRGTMVVADAVPIGNSSHVVLPKVWLGKKVLVVDTAFFNGMTRITRKELSVGNHVNK